MKRKLRRSKATKPQVPQNRLADLSPEQWALARVIRLFREHLHLSLHQMEALSGVKRQTISYAERGLREPTLHSLRGFARAFGVTEERLVGFSREWLAQCRAKSLPARG